MWWCCGRTNFDALGCLFSKHITKVDDEEEKKDDNGDDSEKRIRCYCCKKLGHRTDSCDVDPNFRKNHHVEEEFMRLAVKKT